MLQNNEPPSPSTGYDWHARGGEQGSTPLLDHDLPSGPHWAANSGQEKMGPLEKFNLTRPLYDLKLKIGQINKRN